MEGNYSFNIFPIYSTTFPSKYKNKRAKVPSALYLLTHEDFMEMNLS